MIRTYPFPVRRVRLAELTTLGVGGPAELCSPSTVEELASVVSWCAETKTPWRVLGRGTHVIAPDGGVEELVIHTGRLRKLRFDGDRITAGAGVPIWTLSRVAARRGLVVGAGRAPASVGGAVRRCDGGWWDWLSDRIEKVRVVETTGRVRELTARESLTDCVIAEVDLVGESLVPSSEVRSYRRVLRKVGPSRDRGLWEVFRRGPGRCEGIRRGLEHIRVGGAQLRGNFILNLGNATARDIDELIVRFCDAVEKRGGAWVETLVERWA